MEKATIMVVEDERIVALDLQITLQQAGYAVEGLAACGEDAVRIADRVRPDLILMDIMLQGEMDGISAASQIRKQLGIPVIYLSSCSDPGILERAKETEPIGYISKPYEKKSLLTTIEVSLHQFRAIQLRAQSALLASESRFRSIFEASVVGIAIVDHKGRYIETNPALQRILDLGPEELRQKTFAEIAYPEELSKEEQLFRELFKGTCAHYQVEKRVKRADGKAIWVRINMCPFPDGAAQGEERHYALRIVEEITEVKTLKERCMRAQRLESVGLLTGGLGHNLNNLLTPILAGIPLLKPLCAGNNAATTLLNTMGLAARRSADIVGQLLAFGRGAESGLAPLQPTSVVREVAKLASELFPKTISVYVSAPTDTWTIMGNASELHQSILNLCLNARDAMDSAGILTLSVENQSPTMAHTSGSPNSQPGPRVLIRVIDTGAGMTKDVIEKLFSPFFTTKPVDRGTGLGLSTTQTIIKRHGGSIEVKSEPGQGAEFRIYLPAIVNNVAKAELEPQVSVLTEACLAN